jgi:hypothetical protein
MEIMTMNETLRNIFFDILIDGAVMLEKRRLIWVLGWGQDRPGAWRDLLDRWNQFAAGQKLSVAAVADKVILTTADPAPAFVPLTKWAEVDAQAAAGAA